MKIIDLLKTIAAGEQAPVPCAAGTVYALRNLGFVTLAQWAYVDGDGKSVIDCELTDEGRALLSQLEDARRMDALRHFVDNTRTHMAAAKADVAMQFDDLSGELLIPPGDAPDLADALLAEAEGGGSDAQA